MCTFIHFEVDERIATFETLKNRESGSVVEYKKFESSDISCLSLSTNELHNSEWSTDSFSSIYSVCDKLAVGLLHVTACRNSPSMYFAREGRLELQRIKSFLGDVRFPVIGFVVSPVTTAGGAEYETYKYDIRAHLMRWQLNYERRARDLHLNAKDVLLFLKDYNDKVLSGYDANRLAKVASMHQKLYCEADASGRVIAIGSYMPSPDRSKEVASFVVNVPRSALEEVTCEDSENVLTKRVLTQAWKKGSRLLTESVQCNLMRGLSVVGMNGTKFRELFLSYIARAKKNGDSSGFVPNHFV